jgi:Ca2+-binding RTX toxin-like protein
VAAVSYYGGTSGNDTITGTSAADNIRAGLGDDLLVGQTGHDNYTYMVGDGNDTIDELATGTDVDTLILSGINQADVQFERPFSDLTDVIVRVLATGQTIRLDNQFDQEDGVEKIIFDDGSVLGGNDWSLDGILANLATIYGTAGNDTIYGSTTSNDTLDGGAGDDWLAGEEGSDTYIYAPGYGNDFVNEKATGTDKDILILRELDQNDISIERPSADLTDLVIRIKMTGDTFTLDNQFDQEDGVEKIIFEDGSLLGSDDWSLDGILAGLATITGTASGETIVATSIADRIFGGGGADMLTGGAGNDTFIFQASFGKDTITDFTTGAGSEDLIEYASDVFDDFASVLAAASQVGADTVITADAGNILTLKNVALTNLHQDDFQFNTF